MRSDFSVIDLVGRPPSFLGYSQIGQWIDSLGEALRAEGFVAVVAVLRGGLFPAQCAAFAAGAPLSFVTYDRGRQVASWLGEPPPVGKVLLCDDFAGAGHTLAKCRELVRRTHPDHRVLAIVSDEMSRLKPDWSMHRPKVKTVLPWERECVSPAYIHDYWRRDGAHGHQAMAPDHCYRHWGIDLDGVLCVDVPRHHYEADLSAALETRDELRRTDNAPRLTAGQHVIITGRPACDQARTRAWLDAHGYAGIDVWHRDPMLHAHDEASVALHKATAAERRGITDFVESCPHQAVLISVRAPQIRVFWWRGGEPVLVNAFPAALAQNPITIAP